ncbi:MULTISPECIES: hypothetical protein [unclassified Clostridioides]|uniref:hypothetical protein n=1 Tax=unclassified Clostridioides TaxID=2635829 RepID=UPI001D11BFD8|nr:hypothetical protein [Clostridioides sp. ZZV14-6154]MCC0667798.1 hypothetical protein [Clostridioides sp. ZZV14-6153]MCC0719031.1 hypothetical protein [Clostridioides sp. ZZV14-6105]MCC0727613.1 hypothetical protein [Clostridioides sp. ZZV14-6045]MCC0730217.1 hypothetical protein [Clostridioides sp. ZZV14-6048]MCC0734600.1 hypothetical protein [Clostridioides sp. ZZV14-6009]WLD28204.1 hypothetical protein CDIFMA2_20880 [Clostridioides difficile]
MEIKVIEIFPKDEAKLNEIEMAKARWFVNIVSKKYSKEVLDKAFNTLEEDLKVSKTDA